MVTPKIVGIQLFGKVKIKVVLNARCLFFVFIPGASVSTIG